MVSSATGFRELLRLAFPESSITWLREEQDPGQAVNWVALSEDELSPGDILVMPGEGLDGETLKAAMERGAAGIVLVGGAAADGLLFPIDLPVASLESSEELHSVQRLLLVLLINQRAGLVERGYRIHIQLAQLSAEGAGLSGLVRAMVDISGRGLLVQDKRGYILAEQPSPVLSGIWQDVLTQLNPLSSLPEKLQDRKLAGKLGAPVRQEIPGGLTRLVSPIMVGDVARGYLSLIGMPEEIDELDGMVAEQGAVICAIEMARQQGGARDREAPARGSADCTAARGAVAARRRSMGTDHGT